MDDDALVLSATRRALERFGYSVTCVGSVAGALSASGPFDAAVLDIELPDGSGLELSALLLRARLVKRVVFHTGCARPELVRAAERIGLVVLKGAGSSRLGPEVFGLRP